MSDFDLVLAGTVVLPSMVIEDGYVAVRDGKVVHVGEGAPPHAHERHLLGKALILPDEQLARITFFSPINRDMKNEITDAAVARIKAAN